MHFTATVQPDGDRWRVVARLEQATPPYSFPAEIGVFTGVTPRLQRIHVDSAARTFVLTSPARPDSVVLDPRGWVLCGGGEGASQAWSGKPSGHAHRTWLG